MAYVSTKMRPKVIVVGAGFSGLVAALRLVEKGAEVMLLDSEPRVGGKIYSVPIGGSYANLGAQYFFKSDNEYMNRYVKKADCFTPGKFNWFNWKTGYNGAVWDGQLVSGRFYEMFTDLPVDASALGQLEEAIGEMNGYHKEIAKNRPYMLDKSPKSDLWAELDNKTGAELLSKYHPDVADLLNLLVIPEGAVGVSGTSALLLTGWYGGSGESGNLLVKGGNQKLPEAMADDFVAAGGVLRLSSQVTDIENTPSGVRVSVGDGRSYDADHVVMATTAPVARNIVKGMSPEKKAALDAVTYGASMQVALHLKDFPNTPKLGACVFHNAGVNAYLDQLPSPKDDETVISLNISGSEAQQLSDTDLLGRVSEVLGIIYPGFDLDRSIADYAIQKWPDGIVVFAPGFLTKFQDDLRAPVGRIHFAGDYTHSPELSGAAWSGVRAADAIMG